MRLLYMPCHILLHKLLLSEWRLSAVLLYIHLFVNSPVGFALLVCHSVVAIMGLP